MADLPVLMDVAEIEEETEVTPSEIEVEPSLEPPEEEEIMPFVEKPVRRGQPKKKPTKRLRKKKLSAEEADEEDALAKKAYAQRTPKLKEPPSPKKPIQERFNTHLLPDEAAIKKKQLEDDHLSFMKFMSHMDAYKTIKDNVIKRSKDKAKRKEPKEAAKQASAKQEPALAPAKPVKPAAPALLAPPTANDPYSSYFG